MPSAPLPRPVLITGATGFIGRHLVRQLVREDVPVRAFVLPGEIVPAEWHDDVAVARGDVADRGAVAAAVQDAGTVFHLAAVVGDWAPKAQFERVTVAGTRHVLEAAAEAEARVVLVSSIAVYGDQLQRAVCHEDRPHGTPQGHYGWAKQEQERLAHTFREQHDLDVRIVRPANVYGPGSQPWVHGVIDHLRQGRPALLGRAPKNAGLTYVGNVVDVLLRAAQHPDARGRTYNAADGLDVTWAQYIADLARLAGTPPPRRLPLPLARALTTLAEPVWRGLGLSGRP
ncbi:MAG: NAD-dependent epimerase/dehydratase family protein, partial [Bacteroidetes bacterium]|nr:NAD-dependent epimerase/dehydratase family protein [Bacteroidota bacterium]